MLKLIRDFILTKFIDWSYEKERRIIRSKGIFHYSDNDIDRIIFGVNMPEEDKNHLKKLLVNKKIKFFEAEKSKREYAINIKPV